MSTAKQILSLWLPILFLLALIIFIQKMIPITPRFSPATTTELDEPQESERAQEERAQQLERQAALESMDPAVIVARLDLAQQARMADATESLRDDSSIQVTATHWTLILNILGLGVVVAALVLNARATEAATESAKATIKMAKSDRAWVATHGKHSHKYVGDKSDPDNIIFGFTLKNTGKTPALNFRAMTSSIYPPTDDFFKTAFEKTASIKSGYVAPGGSHSVRWDLPRHLRKAMLSHNIPSIVHITCLYETVYNEEYFVERTFETEILVDDGVFQLAFRIFDSHNSILLISSPSEPA